MQEKHPQDFDLLCTTPVTFQYTTNGHSMHFRRPMFVRDALNDHLQVWYSAPFQGPLHIPASKVNGFYRAFRKWDDIVHDKSFVYKVKMVPGDLVIFANRRILHGRTEFDLDVGTCRHLKGTYVNWSDFVEKVRLLDARTHKHT
jgi:hypothetical protein